MDLSHFFAFLSYVAITLATLPDQPGQVRRDDTLSSLRSQAIRNLQHAEKISNLSGCSLATAAIRRDWYDTQESDSSGSSHLGNYSNICYFRSALTSEVKKSYISAVHCLLRLPSKSDPTFASGARNRYDDFVAVHINQTLTIHGTGNFLTWHRYLTWSYERALREECGYQGYQPYWNWFVDADDLHTNPLFDGSDTSMSGDGAFVAHNGSLTGSGNIWLPSGEGDGCVTSGPFMNMTIHLGPVFPGIQDILAPNPSPDGVLGHNPRCLSRDLSDYTASKYFTEENLLNLTTGPASGSIELFQNQLQGDFPNLFVGMHASGHMSVGGEASDLFSSINDPSFYFHHSMVDQIYWLWQALHLNQSDTIAGTITLLNTPPSRDTLKTDIIDLGVNAPDVDIGQVLDTLGGKPLCYIFE